MKSAENRPASGLPEILTGDDEWDRQHRQLHELLARLRTLAADPTQADSEANRHALMDIVGETLAVMVAHFRWEEELMASLPANALTEAHCIFHREEHDGIAERMGAMADRLEHLSVRESSLSLATILGEWLTNHIRGYDQPFVRLLTADRWQLGA